MISDTTKQSKNGTDDVQRKKQGEHRLEAKCGDVDKIKNPCIPKRRR